MGAYTHIYTKQNTQGVEKQSGLSDTMVVWHSAAVGLAQSILRKSDLSIAPCSLTYKGTSVYPESVGVSSCKNVALAINPVYVGPNVLPPGYNADAYLFNSIAFLAPNGSPYLLTYIPPPAATSDSYGVGFLCLPGGIAGNCPTGHRRFPYSFKEFYRQMAQSSHLSPLSYGVVSAAAKLVTPQIEGFFEVSMSAEYDVPNSSIVPAGSIGIITQLVPYSD